LSVEADAAWSDAGARGTLVERSPLLLAAAVAGAYFLAAWLGLGLIARPQDVAVFWPAAGVAAGSMLAVSRPTRPWLAAGIVAATMAVNLLGGNGPAVSLAFALVNAGEGWLVAELLQRRFGLPFRLDRLDRALGLLLAAAAAAALAGVAGAVALRLVGPSGASFWDVTRLFLAADFVGVVTIAPLVLALATTREHAHPTRHVVLEGTALLASLAVTAGYFLGLPPGDAPLPLAGVLAALFPMLLLPAVRCPAVIATAAPAILALATVWHTVHGLGPFSDAAHGLDERVLAAQLFMAAGALCSLSLFTLVAERRRTEAALRGSEARLRAALDLTGLSPYAWDPPTGALAWEPALKRMWGLSADARVDYATFLAGVHPDDRAAVEAKVARAVDPSGDGVYAAEFRVVGVDDGVLRWVSARGQTLFAAGRPVGFVGAARDVTERKAAEEALRTSEARLRLALEAGQMGVWHADIATQKTWWDEAQCRVYGVDPASFAPSDERFFALVHPEDRDRLRAESAAALASGQGFDGEFRIVRADTGATRWVAVRYALARDGAGKPVEVTGVTWDITARKAVEEDARRQAEELDTLYRTMPVGLALLDRELRYRRCNQALAEINGLPAEAHLGRTVREVVPHLADQVEPLFRAVLDTGEPLLGLEIEGETAKEPGVRRAWVEDVNPLRAADGSVAAVNVVVHEVTERKRWEESQRLLTRELDHRAKNLLAIVQSVARQSARSAATVAGFEEALSGRLRAMAAAHDALAASGWRGADLAQVARATLSPYLSAGDGRLRLELPGVLLPPPTAQGLNLALHELATNAAKYGGLSQPGGRVVLTGTVEGRELRLTWREEGGPAVAAEPAREGFGSVLIARVLAQQTGGRVERDWRAGGLICRMTLPLHRAEGAGIGVNGEALGEPSAFPRQA
jgi:PAS domain S-box-containing protein